MIVWSVILGTSAAAILVIAGYILGIKRGSRVREELTRNNEHQSKLLQQFRKQLDLHRENEGGGFVSKDFNTLIETLARQGDAVQQLLEPLARRDAEVENLHGLIQHVIAPLAHHERLAFDLENLNISPGMGGGLALLLDQIAEKGQFWAVLLSSEEGLPLATSGKARDIDRLTAVTSFAALFADRIGRDGAPAPLSLMMHDEANMATLCRIFHVGAQRLLLTAVSTGSHLALTSLDPALSKVSAVLSKRIDG